MTTISAYAAFEAKGKVGPHEIARRAVGPDDVEIGITHCGVCHTDIHFVDNDLGMSRYPLVPGHEIVGEVRSVGSNVSRFKVRDRAAVGCLVDSCGHCPPCQEHEEQYCQNGMTMTYGSPTDDPGGFTYGGYSTSIVVREAFVLNVPSHLDPAGAAPLLCAGITTYSPMMRFGIEKGMKVGIVGLGGLGHMGIKFAHAMGAHTVMITRSPDKGEDARRLGADEVLISTDRDAMKTAAGTFDFILNTIPVSHDIDPYQALLRYKSTQCLVGVLDGLPHLATGPMLFGGTALAGSLIGGLKETQEMLDFCGEHDITADVEIIAMDRINEAYKRMQSSDVRYRFVIDLSTL
jgi:uncharacterized zinc-type alcohol dehydrogenase-like protein